MEKKLRKWTAAWVSIALAWMAVGFLSPGRLPAVSEAAKNPSTAMGAEAAAGESNYFEKEAIHPETTKKKKFPWLWAAAGVVAAGVIVYFTLIKKPKYDLTVEAGAGVTGSPAAGKYTYKKGEKVAYGYSCASDYKNLIVSLDGNEVAISGKIDMDRSHTLRVTAAQIPDYSLIADIEYRISGTPTRGTYRFREGTTVPYQYVAADLPLIAKIDGIPVPVSGSLTMNKDRILKVTFGPPPDIRGKWRFLLKPEGESKTEPQLLVLLSGIQANGKFEVLHDPNNSYWESWIGEIGEYQVSSIEVSMKLYSGTEIYYFFGNFTSSNTISGDYRLDEGDPIQSSRGTFTATRIR